MKKIISSILSLVLLVGICFSVPVTANAADLDSIYDLQLEYTLSDDGYSYVVSGYEIKYTTGDESEISTFNNGVVEIPGVFGRLPVSAIGDNAFIGCNMIQSIKIPDSVTSIGDFAFGNSSIGTIYGSGSIKTLGDYAFYNCDNFIAVNLFSKTTSIGDYCFYDCSSLVSMNLNNVVTSIGDSLSVTALILCLSKYRHHLKQLVIMHFQDVTN